VVLGAIIEKITGADYYSYVKANIFTPAGMTETDSYYLDVPVPNLATGYTKDEQPDARWRANIYELPGRGSSAGGGYSTAGDMLKFVVALGQGYPVAGGLSQSAVNDQAGARTPLALVVCSATLAICLLFLTGLLTNLPKAVLAAVVFTAVDKMVDVAALLRMWRISRSRSGCSIGSPPLNATTEVPSSANLSMRRSSMSVGTGGETLSYSLQ
jgi:hypothetical protein